MSLNALPIIAALNQGTAAQQSETSIIADDPSTVSQPVEQPTEDSELSSQTVIPTHKNRALDQVFVLPLNRTILKWMTNTAARDGKKHLASKLVSIFLSFSATHMRQSS